MSFSGLQLTEFKCFADSGPIRLAPLTLIFGRNNSGKSSVLQSLLLLRQSLGAPSYGPRLNLGGPLYSAGAFTDIVHLHRPDRRVTLQIAFDMEGSTANVQLMFASDDPQSPRLANLAIRGEGESIVEVRRGQGRGGPYELWIDESNRGREEDANFSFPVGGFLPLIGDEPPQKGRPNKARQAARDRAKSAVEELKRLLLGMSVIGPFRRPPERYYELRGAGPPGTDATGREVVDALIQSAIHKGRPQRALFRSVNDWLERIAGVRIDPIESGGGPGKHFSLTLRDSESKRFANFADVGFGVGQALPVIVEGLRTPEGGTFIVQEPEIHLHPDAQLAMADFLVDLMSTGRQVIVETHSEHILLRVRRRILEERGLSPEKVSVIYIGRDKTPAGKVIPLDLDALGQMESWPSGFLQEATDERMALLEEMAKKLEASA